MSSFVESICRIGIFMIAAQAVIHFAPTAKYEKYMKLVVGIIVLLQLLAPINKITNSIDDGLGAETDWSSRLADMEMELERDLVVEEESTFSEEVIKEMEKEIKSRLNSALNDKNYSILKVNVVIDSSDEGNGQFYMKYNSEDNNSYEKYRLNMIRVYVMAHGDKHGDKYEDRHEDKNGSISYDSHADENLTGNDSGSGVYNGDNSDNLKIEKVHIDKIGADEDEVNMDETGQHPSETDTNTGENSRAASDAEKEDYRQKESSRLCEIFATLLGVEEKYMEVSIYGWTE